MNILIFGGAGFVGLNIAEALLRQGHSITLFDRSAPPAAAMEAFRGLPGLMISIIGDVTDVPAVDAAVQAGCDAIVLGAAITAGRTRDTREPEAILQVNLLAQVPILRAAARAGVKRIVNLSSAAAFGGSATRFPELDEDTIADPTSLYAITKFASERVCARLADLWQLDILSVRLSGVFGPWERATGVRDTLSPQAQVIAAMRAGQPAVLERPGLRDWIYAPDVAEAAARLLQASSLRHRLYNISSPAIWSVLDWGKRLAEQNPGFTCRLAEPGEEPTIDLHAPVDRSPLSTGRLADELGWRARFACENSADALANWWQEHGAKGGFDAA